MRAEIVAVAHRTQAIARLIEEREVACVELGLQIAAGMKKPPAGERFRQLTREIAGMVGGAQGA